MPRSLGVRYEDVEFGALAWADARGRCDVHTGVADRGRYARQRPRGVLDVDNEVDRHVSRARSAYLGAGAGGCEHPTVGAAEFSDQLRRSRPRPSVWVPHYLPQWSSRAESAATYATRRVRAAADDPARQGLWCPADHDPLRVSGIQSGVFSGPVGGAIGQQPFRDGLVVRESQPAKWGWTRTTGRSRCVHGWI